MTFERLSAIAFVIAGIAFCIWTNNRIAEETKIIEASGVEVRAKVTRVYYAHGNNLSADYSSEGRRYTASVMVKDSSYEVGDSVLLKVLPKGQSWTGAIVYKKRIYIMPRN